MSRGQFRDLVLSGDRRRSSFSGSGLFPDIDTTFFLQLGRFSQISNERSRYDDDAVDRLNYKYSTFVLLLSIGLITIRQNIGKPIQCWIPQEFTQGWEEYTENFCWVSNTYFHSLKSKVTVKRIKENDIKYYQWIPIILGIQSLFFSLPCILWRWMSVKSGLDIQKILKLFNDGVNNIDDEQRSINQLAKMLHSLFLRHQNHNVNARKRNRWIQSAKSSRKIKFYGILVKTQKMWKCCSLRLPSSRKCSITYCYMLMKLFFLGNVLIQIYVMKMIVGNDCWWFGATTLLDLLQDRHWTESGNFPRVSFCDFETKKLGENLKYTIQCVLPMNMFVEKIYTFLWFWYLMMSFFNMANIVLWIRRLFINPIGIVRDSLQFSSKSSIENGQLSKFIRNFLTQDMVFLLHLVKINIGELIASNLIEELWTIHLKQSESKDLDDVKLSNYFGLSSRVPSLMINDQLFNPTPDKKTDLDIL